MNRETVGKISYDLLKKQPDTRNPIELMRECLTDWDKEINTCIERGKKSFVKDFYVVVETRSERLMPNVLRNQFFPTHDCPTPRYDQTVYKYTRDTDEVEFLWVVPSKEACQYLIDNALIIHESEKQLLQFVIDFTSGDLFRKAKELNGEKYNSPLLDA